MLLLVFDLSLIIVLLTIDNDSCTNVLNQNTNEAKRLNATTFATLKLEEKKLTKWEAIEQSLILEQVDSLIVHKKLFGILGAPIRLSLTIAKEILQ